MKDDMYIAYSKLQLRAQDRRFLSYVLQLYINWINTMKKNRLPICTGASALPHSAKPCLRFKWVRQLISLWHTYEEEPARFDGTAETEIAREFYGS